MYDIEVIDGHNYAIINEGSSTYEFLKTMNSRLVMKKLSAAEVQERIFLTTSEIAPLCKGFRVADLKRLVDVDLLEHIRTFVGTDVDLSFCYGYTFTDYGLEVLKWIKEEGGDVEIRLS